MTLTDFYNKLSEVKGEGWHVDSQNRIVNADGDNPLTALESARNNKRETLKAGTRLGLSNRESTHIYNAAKGAENRGYTQIVRGKLKAALGV